MPIKAAIFDMDGLLINSEPFWRESEKAVFSTLGIHLTTEMCMKTMGWKISEVIRYWYEQQPWQDKSLEKVEDEILAEVEKYIRTAGKEMEGVKNILSFLKGKNIPLGLASSSPERLIHSVIDQLNIRNFFDVVHSAEKERLGKPHPDVYLSAARMLNVLPEECLAFEDSYNGLLSAKKAGMRTVAVPEEGFFEDTRFEIADLKLRSLLSFTEELWKGLNQEG